MKINKDSYIGAFTLVVLSGMLILYSMYNLIEAMGERDAKNEAKELTLTERLDSLKNSYDLLDSTCTSNYVTPQDTAQFIMTVTGTKYQPVEAQCDSDPLGTADGSRINIEDLKADKIRWVALSRDLLWYKGGQFRYGDSIYVHSEQKYIKGWWIVHDCMNARYTNRIDFLQWYDDRINGHNPNLLISNKIIGE